MYFLQIARINSRSTIAINCDCLASCIDEVVKRAPKKKLMHGEITMIPYRRGNLGEVHRLLNANRTSALADGDHLC